MTDYTSKQYARATAADWAHTISNKIVNGVMKGMTKQFDLLAEAYKNDIISGEFAEAQFELSKRVIVVYIQRLEALEKQIIADLEGPEAEGLMDTALAEIKAEIKAEAEKSARRKSPQEMSAHIKDLMNEMGMDGEVVMVPKDVDPQSMIEMLRGSRRKLHLDD